MEIHCYEHMEVLKHLNLPRLVPAPTTVLYHSIILRIKYVKSIK